MYRPGSQESCLSTRSGMSGLEAGQPKGTCGYRNTQSWNHAAAAELRGCRGCGRFLQQLATAGNKVGHVERLHQIRDALLLKKGLCLPIQGGKNEKCPAGGPGVVLGEPAVNLHRGPAVGHGAVEYHRVKAATIQEIARLFGIRSSYDFGASARQHLTLKFQHC